MSSETDIKSVFSEIANELSSPTVLILNIIAIIVLGWFGVFGFQTDNLKALGVLNIFGYFSLLFIITAITLTSLYGTSKKINNVKKYWAKNWNGANLLLIGGFIFSSFMIYLSQHQGKFTLLTIGKNSLFSQFSAQMTRYQDFFVNAIMVPIVEENFWSIVIPVIIISLFYIIGIKYKFFRNKYLQLGTAIVVSGATFAIFHVSQQDNISFIISALVFRTINIILLWGDTLSDIIPFADISLTINYGLHIGNNWAIYGILTGLSILVGNIWGILFLILLVLIIFSTIYYLETLLNKLIKNNLISWSVIIIVPFIILGILSFL